MNYSFSGLANFDSANEYGNFFSVIDIKKA